MEAIINAIAEHIENWTIANVNQSPSVAVKNFGFCELTNRKSRSKKEGNQPIPVTINGTGDRQQVSLDDRYDFIEWVRWTEPIYSNVNVEDQWGLKQGKRKTLPLRIVIAHKVELGEDLIFDIVNNLPDSFLVDGYDFVFMERWSINPNHEEIYVTELGETVYELHRFNWNIYVLNVDIEFEKCVGYHPEPPAETITDEFGICITDVSLNCLTED